MTIEVKFVGDTLADVQQKISDYLDYLGDAPRSPVTVPAETPETATLPDGSPIPKPNKGKRKGTVKPGKRPKPGQAGEASTEENIVLIEDVREALGTLVKVDGNNERVFKILGNYGVQKISDLKVEDYEACRTAADTLLYHP